MVTEHAGQDTLISPPLHPPAALSTQHRFPAQQQFLTKLVVQTMPLLNVVNRAGDPFAEFATTPEIGGQQVTCAGEATEAAFADFTGFVFLVR